MPMTGSWARSECHRMLRILFMLPPVGSIQIGARNYQREVEGNQLSTQYNNPLIEKQPVFSVHTRFHAICSMPRAISLGGSFIPKPTRGIHCASHHDSTARPPEIWLQLYIKDHYTKLGFSEMSGPYDAGYDFKGVRNGKTVVVEAERQSASFVCHGHLSHHHSVHEPGKLIDIRSELANQVGKGSLISYLLAVILELHDSVQCCICAA